MRTVIQRVSRASVSVDGRVVGEIRTGLLVLIGIHQNDTEVDAVCLAEKVKRLRIFPDEAGQMNRSVADVGGELLVISQFTLHADTSKGTRPSFNNAAKPEKAVPLYESFVRLLEASLGRTVQTGRFGAQMVVSLINDGPVTLVLDSPRVRAATRPGG